jgi:hypothetical protein
VKPKILTALEETANLDVFPKIVNSGRDRPRKKQESIQTKGPAYAKVLR